MFMNGSRRGRLDMSPGSSEDTPWLSIVLPTHQGERWLEDTLDSLVAQSDKGFECLVVDSSPDENTIGLAKNYADRLTLRFFKRVDLKHWRSKTNFGFSMARAPHVCMLHQDDFWLPQRSAVLREWLVAAPDISVHLHPSYVVDINGRRLGVWGCPLPASGTPIPRQILIERLLVQNFVSVPAPVIRRDSFLEVGGLDESLWYTGDWDLYLKLARAGAFAYHREALTCFRIHGSSLTMSGSRQVSDFESQMQSVLRSHISALPAARRNAVRSKALVSLRVNACLAAATNDPAPLKHLINAFGEVLGLGPVKMREYLFESRLFERLIPRLRARMAGNL
jgi:hypothetical protein